MEVLNLFSVVLDLLAWTALIRLLYCPGLKFDICLSTLDSQSQEVGGGYSKWEGNMR